MRLEGDDHGAYRGPRPLRVGKPGALHKFSHHVQMSAMHAVKVANAHQRGSEVCRNCFEFVKHPHAEKIPPKFRSRVSIRHTKAARFRARSHWWPDAAGRDRYV